MRTYAKAGRWEEKAKALERVVKSAEGLVAGIERLGLTHALGPAHDHLHRAQEDLSEHLEGEPMGLYRKIYPHTKEVVQHAVDRYDADEDEFPRIVRDRQAALRAERKGEGDAIARVWRPGEWYYLTDGDES